MTVIGYSTRKKYSVLVCDVIGEPVQDRQHCADTIKEAVEIALKDMKEYPFGCATIYTGKDKVVRYITCAGKVVNPNQI